MNPIGKATFSTPESIEPMDAVLAKILRMATCTEEMHYRVQKLRDRIRIAEGKFYLGTPRARQHLGQCTEMAERLVEQINSGNGDRFALMTQLERELNKLLKKTYEFRVKAG